jgi:hypothetical protein
MPGRFAKLVATGGCLLMVVLASRQAEIDSVVQSVRGPASINSKQDKMAVLKPSFDTGIVHTEKIHGPLRTAVEAVGTTAVAVGETFVLRGVISSEEQISDVLVSWQIPQGLELINGTVQESIGLLIPGQPVNFELTLKKLTADNLQVHLMANAARGNFKFGDVAKFNTVDQEKIKERVRRLVEANQRTIEEQRAQSSNKELKVFH